MKHTLFAIVAISLIALSCTEEIIKIQKEIDTVYVSKPSLIDQIKSTDTVEVQISVPVLMPGTTDTIYIEKTVYRIDSIFTETTVYDTDTVVVSRTVYADTLIWILGHSTHYVPHEMDPYITWFYTTCREKGLSLTGVNELWIEYKPLDIVLPAVGFEFWGQFSIYLNDNLTFSEMFIPLCRELARHEFGAQYSQDPESIMNPFYSPHEIRWDNKDQHMDKIDEIFSITQ